MELPAQTNKTILVPSEKTGQRLDLFMAEALPDISRSKLQQACKNNLIFLNGKPVRKKEQVKAGDQITINIQEIRLQDRSELKAQDIALDIIYEDEFYCAINKPAGMVVHPGHGNPDNTVANALLFHFKSLSNGSSLLRPGIVHRLDKDTSGILLIAKTNNAHDKLAAAFAQRKIQKEYLAICVGHRPPESGLIDAPLARSKREPTMRSIQADGKAAQTEFKLLHYESGISLMHLTPHTGRTHQIRVHCSSKNFPVVADTIYGGGKEAIMRLPVLERPFAHKIYHCFNRQALHARRISLVNPMTGSLLTLAAPLPDDFEKALRLFQLGIADCGMRI
jgi:23S rRNA pseudouridine1911/1915/1917 synthase